MSDKLVLYQPAYKEEFHLVDLERIKLWKKDKDFFFFLKSDEKEVLPLLCVLLPRSPRSIMLLLDNWSKPLHCHSGSEVLTGERLWLEA